MSSLNKVTIIGNVGKEPEVRSFQNGDRVASFSVATSERWKDRNSGEQKERTEWHRISVLNQNLVGVVEKYVKKGARIYIEGQLETRKWTDKDGQDKYSTEVMLRPYRGEIILLDNQPSSEAAETQQSTVSMTPQPRPSNRVQAVLPEDFEDEIPF